MDVAIADARASGSVGCTLGDTLSIHDTNLRFAGIDTRLIEQLIPHFSSPRRGVLGGRLTAAGGRNELVLNSDVTLEDQREGRSRMTAVGDVRLHEYGCLRVITFLT